MDLIDLANVKKIFTRFVVAMSLFRRIFTVSSTPPVDSTLRNPFHTFQVHSRIASPRGRKETVENSFR